MATIEDFILRMKVEGQGAVKSVSGTIQNLKDDISDLGQVGGPLAGTINGIIGKLGPLGTAAGLAAVAFAGLGSRAITLAGELSDISGATGIAAGTLMNFRQSVVEAGGKAEDFAQIAAKLNQSVQEAASGNETFQKAFQRLGVYVTDAGGKVRNTEEILRDIIDKFKGGQISSEQYAAAIDILGKNINKLELSKLNATPDAFTDEKIKQIDKYNDAIDKFVEKLNFLAITVAGPVAAAFNSLFEDIDKNIKVQEDLDKKLAEQGKAQVAPGLTAAIRGFFGMGPRTSEPLITRNLSEAEKRQRQIQKQIEDNAAEHANEMERLSKRGSAGEGGGYGATPEATVKAREELAKRLKILEVEQAKQTQLAANNERLSAILLFADQEEAIRLKSQAAIKDIEINSAAEISKARIDIYAQERLTDEEKAKEFAAKKKEIELKAAADIQRARSSMSEQLTREYERIQSIITQSKARVDEERALNDLLDQRNKFTNENATATDKERQRAQELFDLEQNRLKTLRQIALIKDLPPEERLKREQEINDIYEQRRQKTLAQQDADRALQGNFEAGFQRAYRQYVEDSQNAFETAGRLFRNLTQGFEDAFVEFAKTGKFEFKGFINSILEDLLRSQVRQLIGQLFSGGGSKGGGILGSFGKLLGFADGGIIPTNGPVLVGERGPEIIAGAAGRTVIPNDQLGGSMVTYNINAVDAMSFKQMIAADPTFLYAVTEQGRRKLPGAR